ncbi:DUF397 domain-containing protein [Streptomyces tailanensis]|uniref:DUF397 domain-containing protein n=1 Tax=Streptomyces tailanensis TaxID=2569858 RepID=UPI00122E324B|nr:DUF397 domain-containing protein [Streptomyces tailanensis]
MNRTVRWQKSTFSHGGEGDTCVELAATPTAFHLRESDDPTIRLTTTHTQSPARSPLGRPRRKEPQRLGVQSQRHAVSVACR